MNQVGRVGNAAIIALSVFIIINPAMDEIARLIAAVVLAVGSFSHGALTGTTGYRNMLKNVLSESTLDRVVSDMNKAADKKKEK